MRSDGAGLWRVIYIARGEEQAQQIEAALVQAGFMVARRHMSSEDAGLDDIEIKVLDGEAGEARLFLMEHGL